MQVDHIKPTLKPPGTHRLILKYGQLVSNSALNSNLRRYSWGAGGGGASQRSTLAERNRVPGGGSGTVPVRAHSSASSTMERDPWKRPTRAAGRGIDSSASEPVLGRAVQVVPMKPMLEAHGTKRLNLEFGVPP